MKTKGIIKRIEIEKILLTIIIFSLLVFCFVAICYFDRNYTMTGFVVEKQGNVITLEDVTGNLWDYEIDTTKENYSINDNVKIYFNDNCSNSNRIDDIIIKIKRLDKTKEIK